MAAALLSGRHVRGIVLLLAAFFTFPELASHRYCVGTAFADCEATEAADVSDQLTKAEAAQLIRSTGARISFDCPSEHGPVTWVAFDDIAVKDADLIPILSLGCVNQVSFGPKADISEKGWAYLRQLQTLRELWITGPLPDRRTVQSICQIDQLNLVELHVTKVGDSDRSVLADLKSLKSLWLDDPQLEGRSLAQFPALPALERLTLSAPRLRPYHLRYLDRFPNLRYLHLMGFTVSDTGMKYLAALRKLEEIRGSVPHKDGCGESKLDGVTERGLSYLQDLKHLEHVTGFVDGTVRAWVNLEESVASKWSKSYDGRLSLRLLVSADRIPKQAPMWVIAELRNNSKSPTTTLRPFARLDDACQRISIEGPSGSIVFTTPFCTTNLKDR